MHCPLIYIYLTLVFYCNVMLMFSFKDQCVPKLIYICKSIILGLLVDLLFKIRNNKSKKDRQHNGQKKKDKQRYITQKTIDRATRTPL
jgi:hypothetical protein